MVIRRNIRTSGADHGSPGFAGDGHSRDVGPGKTKLCWDGSTCMLIYINQSISNLLKTYVHSSSLLSYVFLASTCFNGGEIHEDKLDLPAHFTERSAAATSQAKWNHWVIWLQFWQYIWQSTSAFRVRCCDRSPFGPQDGRRRHRWKPCPILPERDQRSRETGGPASSGLGWRSSCDNGHQSDWILGKSLQLSEERPADLELIQHVSLDKPNDTNWESFGVV